MNNIQLRPADINDLATLQRWDEQEHVLASDPNDDWNWEVELQRTPVWREQLIAERNGEPIGFIQVIDPAIEDSHYWGDCGPNLRALDIWIGDEHNLSKGYGSIMMRLAIERCFTAPNVTNILIDPLVSNIDSHRFYERLGFQFVEQRRFGLDECFVYELPRNLVLYDGTCGFCQFWRRFIEMRDHQKKIVLKPLEEASDKNTVIFYEAGTRYEKSTAALRIAGVLGWPWRATLIFLLVPKWLRDRVYDWVAKHRHGISCQVK